MPRKVGLSVPKGMGPSVHYIDIFSFDFKLISCSTLVIEKPFIPKTLVLNKGSLSCNSAVSYFFYRGHSKMHFTHLYTKAFVHSIVYIFYFFLFTNYNLFLISSRFTLLSSDGCLLLFFLSFILTNFLTVAVNVSYNVIHCHCHCHSDVSCNSYCHFLARCQCYCISHCHSLSWSLC